MKKFIKFIFLIFTPLVLGFITSLLFDTSSFTSLNKPFGAPPAWLFPIVWSILYLLMGISYYIVFDKRNKNTTKYYVIQLILNLIWSFLFFSFKLYTLSAIWIVILMIFVSLMIDNFIHIKKIAGLLQIPYFFWLIIALYLNIGVAILN